MASTAGPLFTVVIPTYNRPQLLQRAIESVLRQECGDFEIIVVDDGSDLNSASVVGRCADSRIEFIRNRTNLGVAKARNEGIARARGRYITFLDDDDEFKPQFLRAAQTLLSDDIAIDMCWSGVEIRRGDSESGVGMEIEQREFQLNPDAPANHRQLLCIGTGFGVTIRRDVLERVGAFNDTLLVSEDTDLFIRLILAGARFGVVPGANVVLHEHAGPKLTSLEMNRRTIDETAALMTRHERELVHYPWIMAHLRAHLDWLELAA